MKKIVVSLELIGSILLTGVSAQAAGIPGFDFLLNNL